MLSQVNNAGILNCLFVYAFKQMFSLSRNKVYLSYATARNNFRWQQSKIGYSKTTNKVGSMAEQFNE